MIEKSTFSLEAIESIKALKEIETRNLTPLTPASLRRRKIREERGPAPS
jgi:hypothetical protein